MKDHTKHDLALMKPDVNAALAEQEIHVDGAGPHGDSPEARDLAIVHRYQQGDKALIACMADTLDDEGTFAQRGAEYSSNGVTEMAA